MKQDSYITDIEKLKKWFDLCQTQEEKRPYFTIYRGNEAKVDRVIYRNSEISEPEEAWDALQNILEMHTDAGGTFRIFITGKPGFSNGMTTIFKVPGQFPQMPQSPYMAGPYGSGMYGNMSIREVIEEEKARERKFWELEQRIKDLQAEQEAKVGEMDSMLQEFLPILKDLGHKFGMKIMGYGPAPQMPHMAPATDAAEIGSHLPDQEGYDYDVIEPALDELRAVMPDVEGGITKLARWAKQNPEMAKNLLQNLD